MRLWIFILFNSFLLIGLGIAGYFLPEPPLPTSILPAIFGFVFLIGLPLFKKNLKIARWLFLPLHLFLIIAIFGFIWRAAEVADWVTVGVNAALMLGTSVVSFLLFKKWRQENATARTDKA